jgi:plastocyanin
MALQDATPAAMPVVGPQADGSTLWKVALGGMVAESPIEFHTFFPGEITINAGDSIWFAEDFPMFHTVTFPGPEPVPPLFIPDPEVDASTPVAGPPKLIFNPILLMGTPEWKVDGTGVVSTPVDAFMDPPAPFVFSFPVAGTYDYVCIPHAAVMHGKVIVQEAGSALPLDQAGVDAAEAAQMDMLKQQGQAELEKYATAASTAKADGGNLWEVTVGAGGATSVRVQAILPGELEIKVGDSIHFTVQSPGEPHTVSLIGAGETPPDDPLVESFADGSPKLVENPLVFFPQGGTTWSGTGWLHSGFMGIPELGLPMEFEVLFDTPGDYIPYCFLHGSADGERMAMKLKVGPA